MEIKFLKDSKWKIGAVIETFKEGEHADVPDKIGQEMIDKKYGVLYHDIEHDIEKEEATTKEKEDAKRKNKEAKERKKKEEKIRKQEEKLKNKKQNVSIHTQKNKHEIEKD